MASSTAELCERCGDRLPSAVPAEAPKNSLGGPLPWHQDIRWPICGECDAWLEREARAALPDIDAPAALRRTVTFLVLTLVTIILLDRLVGVLYILGSGRPTAAMEVALVRAALYEVLPRALLFLLTIAAFTVGFRNIFDPWVIRRQFEDEAKRA